MNKRIGSLTSGETSVAILTITVAVLGAWGWVWNIIKLATADFSDITGLLVLRIIGVFIAPLGAVLGFL